MRSALAMIWKELTQVSNRSRFSILMASLAALLALVFILMAYGRIYERPERVTPESMAYFGRSFFYTAAAVLTIAMSVAVLVIAAGIVVQEHVGRRLELLLVTPLAPPAIIAAKAFSVFARAAAGLLVGLPVFAFLLIFGGVDQPMVLAALLFISSNMLLYASMGLLASILGRKTSSCLGWAGALALAWNLLPVVYILLVMLLMRRGAEAWLEGDFSQLLFSLSPFRVFVWMDDSRPGNILVTHTTGNAVLSLVFLLTAFVVFRPVAARLISTGERRKRRREGWFRRLTRWKRTASPEGGGRLARLFDNGMIAREISSWRPRRALYSLAWFAFLYTFVFLVASVTRAWPGLYDANDQSALFMAEQIGFCFLLSVRAATRLAREKESRTIQQLLMTRLGRVRIVAGKAAALAVEQAPGILFLAAHLVFILTVTQPNARLWWLVLLGLPLTLSFAIALGLYFSLAAARVVSAVVMTALTWVFGAFGVIFILSMLTAVWGVGLMQSGIAVPLALVTAVTLTVSLVVAVRRGYGLLLAGLSVMLLIACGIVAGGHFFDETGIFGGRPRLEFENAAGFLMLPGPFSSLLGDPEANAYAMTFAGIQAVLVLWAVSSMLLGLEAKAKRAY